MSERKTAAGLKSNETRRDGYRGVTSERGTQAQSQSQRGGRRRRGGASKKEQAEMKTAFRAEFRAHKAQRAGASSQRSVSQQTFKGLLRARQTNTIVAESEEEKSFLFVFVASAATVASLVRDENGEERSKLQRGVVSDADWESTVLIALSSAVRNGDLAPVRLSSLLSYIVGSAYC